MWDVGTDHQILAFGQHIMHLVDRSNGNVLVSAIRNDGDWTVNTELAEVEPVITGERGQAITEMCEMALRVLPGDGYSTLVPHGLREMA